MIKIIVAMDPHGLIGDHNKIPWTCKEELQHFKAMTLHHHVLMGRTTWESIARPLPGRSMMVLSKNLEYNTGYHEVVCVHHLECVLEAYRCSKKILYICGGNQLYQQCLPFADELCISLMKTAYIGDCYFPSFDHDAYTCIVEQDYHEFHYYQLRKKGVSCDL